MPRENPIEILIADDNQTNQRVIVELLKYMGHAPTAVYSGEEVIEALKRKTFGLVILDCVMPGLDGFATARAIRASDPRSLDPQIPILAITALAASGDRERCLEAGMNEYISKPVMAEALFEHVNNLIGEKRAVSGQDKALSPNEEREKRRPYPDLQRIVRSMSGDLIENAADWITSLQRAVDAENWEEVRVIAHRIRGTADIIDNRQLSGDCAAMEKSAAQADSKTVRILAPGVVALLHTLVNEVGGGG